MVYSAKQTHIANMQNCVVLIRFRKCAVSLIEECALDKLAAGRMTFILKQWTVAVQVSSLVRILCMAVCSKAEMVQLPPVHALSLVLCQLSKNTCTFKSRDERDFEIIPCSCYYIELFIYGIFFIKRIWRRPCMNGFRFSVYRLGSSASLARRSLCTRFSKRSCDVRLGSCTERAIDDRTTWMLRGCPYTGCSTVNRASYIYASPCNCGVVPVVAHQQGVFRL
jgi:hypothetical protein